MIDFALEEKIRIEDSVRQQCPNILNAREDDCIGWKCTWINRVKNECIFLTENPFTKTPFYEFVLPKAKIKARRTEK